MPQLDNLMIPFLYAFMFLFAVWYFRMNSIIENWRHIKWRKMLAENTRILIDRFYSGEQLSLIDVSYSYIEEEGPYAAIYYAIKQRDILTQKCPHCRKTNYLEDEFEFKEMTSETIMTHGRITKKGTYDERFNTDFEIIYTYHYEGKCPSCHKHFIFTSENEELKKFPYVKLVFKDEYKNEVNRSKISNLFKLTFLTIFSFLVLIATYAYATDQNILNFIKQKISFFKAKTMHLADQYAGSKYKIGVYYVSDSAYYGINMYKDPQKNVSFDQRIMSMDKVEITLIKNGMGYSKHINGKELESDGAWFEMQFLVPQDSMFIDLEKALYKVRKIDKSGIPFYKDRGKKNIYFKKIPTSTKIEILKVVNGMGFTLNYINKKNETLSGWVEMKKLKKIEQ